MSTEGRGEDSGGKHSYLAEIAMIDGEAVLQLPQEVIDRFDLREGDDLVLSVVDGRLVIGLPPARP